MFAGLTFKVAAGVERQRVLELRRRVYVAELGHDGIDDYDDDAYQLIALDEAGETVAGMRIVGPAQRPFDVERFVDLSQHIGTSRAAGDIGRLCIHPDRRLVRRGNLLHLGMLKLAVAVCGRHGITDLVTLSLPHLRNLYHSALFASMGITYEHPIWGPVHPMHLDLLNLKGSQRKHEQPLVRFLLVTEFPNFHV